MRFALLRPVALSTLTCSMAVVASSQAHAQDTAPTTADGPQLEDIIVTASKRGEENLQKVPISISAYSGDQLETLGIQSFSKIDLKTPGLVFTENAGTVQPYIRGVGTEFPFVGLEPSISVYLDDVYWQRASGSNYNLIDVDQVQVLKGPQGTLYGRNATGGAILLTTHDPEFNYSGRASVQSGNLDHQQADLVLNAKLSDTLAIRVAGRYADQDGYVKNPITGINYGGYRNYEGRAKALYQTDGFSALLTVGYNESANRSGIRQQRLSAPLCLVCAITGATPPPGRYQTYQGVADPVKSHVYYGSLTLEAELGSLTLTSISALRKARQTVATDESNFAGAPPGKALDLLTFAVTRNAGKDALQEFRLGSQFDGAFNFLVGVNGQYTEETFATKLTGAAFAAAGPGAFQASLDRLKTKSASVYAELYYDLTDTIKVTAGGRFNYDKKEGRSAPGGIATQPPYAYATSSKNFTPQAVLAWSPDAAQNYYLSYGSGFKSGGFNYPSFGNSPTDILKPEKLQSFEAGAKNSFWSNRIRTTAAVFYYRYSNIQVAFADATRGSVRQNAGKGEGYGAEFDVQIAATDALTLGLGYSYLHARFTEYPNASLFQPTPVGITPLIVDLKGAPFTRAPDHTAYASATYGFDLPTDWKGSMTAIGRYTSAYDFNPGRGGTLGLDYQKAFGLLNLSGSFGPRDGGFKIGLYVNNLFDKFYLQNASTGAFGAYYGAALPRTYGGSVTIDF